MTDDDEIAVDQASFLVGEAVRRVMMGKVKGFSPECLSELKTIAWDVMGKILPAALTPDEFDVVDAETGLYPPDFRKNYADRFGPLRSDQQTDARSRSPGDGA